MKYSRTYLLLERRTSLHRVHNGTWNAGVQIPDGILDVQFQRIVIVIHRCDEPPDYFHVARPCEIQFVCRLCQAASATFTYLHFFSLVFSQREDAPATIARWSRVIISQVYQKFVFSLSLCLIITISLTIKNNYEIISIKNTQLLDSGDINYKIIIIIIAIQIIIIIINSTIQQQN